MPKWNDVAQDERYINGTPEVRQKARQRFFEKYVSPKISQEEYGSTWEDFNTRADQVDESLGISASTFNPKHAAEDLEAIRIESTDLPLDSKMDRYKNYFNDNIAKFVPIDLRDEQRDEFLNVIRSAEEYSANLQQQQDIQAHRYRERVHYGEEDPKGTAPKRMGQAFIRGLSQTFAGFREWEKKYLPHLDEHYDTWRKQGWKPFKERHQREMKYDSPGLWNDVAESLVESTPNMLMAGAAAVPLTVTAGPAGLMTAAKIGAAGMATAAGTLAGIARNTGIRMEELQQDPRYADFSEEELRDMAMESGIVNGAIEGFSTVATLGLMKYAGKPITKALRNSKIGQQAFGAAEELVKKTETFKGSEAGKAVRAAMLAPAGGAFSEMSEEVTQEIWNKSLDKVHLEGMGYTDAIAKASAEFAEEAKAGEHNHLFAVSGLAGAVLPGGVGAVSLAMQAKAKLFEHDVPVDHDRAIKELDDVISNTKDPEARALLEKEKIKLNKIKEAEETNKTVDPKTLEEEIAKDQARYDELRKRSEGQVETGPVTAPEPAPEPVTEPKAPTKEEPLATEKQAKKEDTSWRKKTVKDIKKADSETATDLINKYKQLENLNRNDKARLRTAKERLKEIQRKETEAQDAADFNQAVQDIEEDYDYEDTYRKPGIIQGEQLNPRVQPNATWGNRTVIDAQNDNRPHRYQKSGITTPFGTTKDNVLFHRMDPDRPSSGEQIISRIEDEIANGTWKFQALFDNVVASVPQITLQYLNDGTKSSGNLRTTPDVNDTRKIARLILSVNGANQTSQRDGFDQIETTLVHELLHGLHKVATGALSESVRARNYLRDISKVFSSIPKEELDRFKALANEYKFGFLKNIPEMAEQYSRLTPDQKTNRFVWYHILYGDNHGVIGKPPTHRNWDEFMSFALSEPSVMRQLSEIKSDVKDAVGRNKSIAAQLIETFIRFFNQMVLDPIPGSILDDLVNVSAKYTRDIGSPTFTQHVDQIVREEVYQEMPKRGLTDADRELLARRREERGGLTPVEYWANRRNASQAEYADIRYKEQTKQGIPADRWNLDGAFDGLNSKTEAALKTENAKLQAKISKMLDEGYSDTNAQLKYYLARQQGISHILDRRQIKKYKARALQRQAMETEAGRTKTKQRAYYKRQYKQAIKDDAPYSHVVWLKNKLIDHMGDAFYTWSGEPNPKPTVEQAEKETLKEQKEKKQVEPLETYVDPETGHTITKYPEFTEEDRRKQDEGTDEESQTVAPNAEVAAKLYFETMQLVNDALDNKVGLTKETVAQSVKRIIQAREYKVIDKQTADEDLKSLEVAMTNGETNSSLPTSPGALDPIQEQMDKVMPVRVKFDAYHAKEDGYIPFGYMFTIMEEGHPARFSTFAVLDLNPETIKAKFEDIADKYGMETSQDAPMKWTKFEDSVNSLYFSSDPVPETGESLTVDINHVLTLGQKEHVVGSDGTYAEWPLGTIKANVTWALVDDQGNDTFERKFTIDEEGNQVLAKSNIDLGRAALWKCKSALEDIMAGKHKTNRPGVIMFSSIFGDDGKTKTYLSLAELAVKKLNKLEPDRWVLVINESGFNVVDTQHEPAARDIERAEEARLRFNASIDTAMQDIQYDQAPEVDREVVEERINRFLIDTAAGVNRGESNVAFLETPNYAYHHSDGGRYVSVDATYDAETGLLVLAGEHEHYGGVTLLNTVRVPSDREERRTLFNQLFREFERSMVPIEESVVDNEIDIQGIERRLAEREPIDPGSLLDDIQESPARHEADDPQMEADLQEYSKGVPSTSWFKRQLEVLKKFGQQLSREFEFMKRSEYADVQEYLRKMRDARAHAARQATENLTRVVANLSQTQYKNLERLALFMDLEEQVRINEEKIANGFDPDTVVRNPFDWTDDQIRKEQQKVYDLVRNDPETYQAWKTRQDVWFKLREAYADSMNRLGYDAATRLQRVYYFRHQVLDMIEKHGLKGSNKLAAPTGRSFLRKRGAKNWYAMNLNFIQAEFEVMAQMAYDTQLASTIAYALEEYGSEDPVEGYVQYNPREGSIFYMADSIPSKLMEQAASQGLKILNVNTKDIKQVLALGGKYKGYYLPEPIANQLNEGVNNRPRGWISRFFHGIVTGWKHWQLYSPVRVIKYNLRNLTGDMEAIFLGNPKVFMKVGQAARKMITKHEDWTTWKDLGGEQGGITYQELGKVLTADEFSRFTQSTLRGRMARAGMRWLNKTKDWSAARESWLRFAAYLQYMEELDRNGGHPDEYTASLRETIEPIQGNENKAFNLSSDLLGAYDKISLTGRAFREHLIPFWSFQEVNMRRAANMFTNAMRNDKLVLELGKRAGAKGVIAAWKVGKLLLKLAFFSAAVQVWNSTMYPEEEEALPKDMRERSHIILGVSKKDGKPQIIYFPRVGVVEDMLEWGGFQAVPAQIRDVIIGHKTAKEVVDDYNYGLENVKGFAEKVVGGLSPVYKMPAEFIMGQKVFPSIFNPQPITDRLRYIEEQTHFPGLFDRLHGRPTPKYSPTESVATAAIYKQDKARLGWLSVQQEISEYMRKNKLKGTGFITTDSGDALYNIGKAQRYGDKKALVKYLKQYVDVTAAKLGTVNTKVMQEQWDKLHPLQRLSETHRRIFLADFLKTERGRHQLALAYEYFAEMKAGMPFARRNN